MRGYDMKLGVGGIGELCEAADFSGGSSLVNDALFGGLVNDRLRGIQFSLCFLTRCLSDRRPDIFDDTLNSCFRTFISQPSDFILASTFDRRFVICQETLLLSRFCLKRYKY